MADRALYSIKEARQQLGGISRNSVYRLLNNGELASVIIGCRRFITAEAIAQLIKKSATSDTPADKLPATPSRSGLRCLYLLPQQSGFAVAARANSYVDRVRHFEVLLTTPLRMRSGFFYLVSLSLCRHCLMCRVIRVTRLDWKSCIRVDGRIAKCPRYAAQLGLSP
jgi:hypothetical protein